MNQFLSILKQYWGYDNFRALQGDIVKSISEGRDTSFGRAILTYRIGGMGIRRVICSLIGERPPKAITLSRAIPPGMSSSSAREEGSG
jgi:ATP-dependent DNA helicase RecQ